MKPWPKVRLGEVLARSQETIELQPEADYREITVKLWGKGVVLRGIIRGTEISTARRFVAKAGQFILSRIDARNGAIGVVPPELDGAVVTTDFPLFTPNSKRLDVEFLGWLGRTPAFVELCQRASEGTTNRVRLQEERFLALEIPLPPLPEQKRVVARIEELAAQIAEARSLRQQAAEEAEVLVGRAAAHALDESGWNLKPLSELLREAPRNGLGPQQRVEAGGRPMLRINAVSSAPGRYVDIAAQKLVDVTDEVARPFVAKQEDVFIVRYNGDINRVAKAAIFKSDAEVIYPDKLIRLRPSLDQMTPDFLVYALGSRGVRAQIEELGKTTAGQIGISGGDAKSFRVPTPPLKEQLRIVAELDALQAEVDTLKRLQAETSEELDALLPSVLDKAFKGEL